MTEERLGEDWKPGMRVQYWSRMLGAIVEGQIIDRSWGRDKGKAIYYLTVQPDGEPQTELLSWNQVTWPKGETRSGTVVVRGKRRPAVELGRHHGRVYLTYHLTPTGPEHRGWFNDTDFECGD